jgi:phosphatidylglycerol lysyltransferase
LWSEDEKRRVLDCLKRYGYQSQSYNILRDDKSYFFSPSGKDGVIAYVVHAKIALAAGDPVCDPSGLSEFAGEFRSFCRSRKWRCCFQAVTDRCRDILMDLGFSTIKIGEEPIFDLDKITWEGGRFQGLRRDARRARKHGLEVVEYRPLSGRRPDWEIQMEELSTIWRKFKGSGEFSFLIGEPGLADPGERKYFLAMFENRVEAFVVCNPIYARNGIYFDLMRRREKTVSGTSQLLISESFRLLKEQGYEMAALGTAPLASKHVDDQPRGHISHIIELTLDLAFDHFGYFHRFKPIYEFKKQFGPTSWEGCYLAYGSRGFNPVILYALLKAYDPSGVKGKLSRQIQHAWVSIRKFDRVPAGLLDKLRSQDPS